MKGHRDWMLMVFAALTMVYVQAQAQQSVTTSSTYGEEFFIGFLPTVGGSSFATVRLTIGTPATTARFVIQTFDQVIEESNVTSSSPVVVSVPMDLIVTGNDFSNRRKGIRVTAVESSQLFVLAETFVSSLIHGTFLAYPDPRESLGDVDIEYEYIIVSTDDPGITNSVFLLVGCDDNTTFTVVPSQTIELPSNLQTSSFAPVSVNQDTRSHQLTLHQMQTLLVSHSSLDLTGTRVISNKPLTVISGHECANVPQHASGCEPLAVQIPPVATWGTEFLLAPFAGRNNPQQFKIVASNDTSSLTITCGDSPSAGALIQNSVYTLETSNYCHIESVSQIFVIQLATGSTTDGRGDPAIAIVSPIDQYINNIEFISLPTSIFPSNYISILVPTENYDPNSIRLNDRVLSCQWQEIYNLSRSIVGYGCNTTIMSGTTAAVQHKITYTIPGGRLSVTAYGFNTPPRAAGYAYLTGQQLKITEVTDPGDIVFESDSLPLFDLETFPGVMELSREETDPTSDLIIIDRGLILGNDIVTTAQVNENGVISFNGQPWRFSYPERFPTNYYWTRNGLAVAPFWSDNDIRRSGAVRYAVYSSSEGALNQQGREILDQVNSYIQAQQPEGEEVFTGRWILIAHWDHVHPSPHGDDDHRGIPEEMLERTNNYQAIVVTNNTRTFVIYTYTCGEIQWSALGRSRAAVVGYNARGDYYSNHPSSGFSAIGNSVSCTFQLGRRQARQAPPPSMNLMMDVGTSNSVVQQRGECLNAISTDMSFLFGSTSTPQEMADMLDPCPCELQQVRDDFGRFVLQPGDFPSSTVCYVSARSITIPLLLNRITLTQQCCYNENNRALQTSMNDMYPGTMLFYHPIYNPSAYQQWDKSLRDACCGGSVCRDVDFFTRRPISNCDNYSAPSGCIGWGDPHYVTFDGRFFDFQGEGEFVLLEVLPVSGQMSPVFTLHGQMDDSVTWMGATTHRGLAFGRSDLAFHVGMLPGFRIFQTKPQENVGEIRLNDGDSFSSPSIGNPWPEILLTRRSNRLEVAFYDIDIALIISTYERPTEYNVDFEVRVPQIFRQKTRGFCGNLDLDDTNEFHRRSGTNLISLQPESDGNRYSDAQLFTPFQSWRIGSDESSFVDTNLLYQPNRGKRQTVQNNTFMPVFFDELNFTTEQRMICEDNPQCLFDLVVTRELGIATNTLQFEKEANATKESFENTPPIILADSVFRVSLGEESIYSLSVSDPDGDNFTLTLMNILPDDPKLEQTEEEYLFVWTLLEITNVTLTFVATDSKGAAAIFSPTVELCACVNNGNCTRDGLLVSSPTIVMNCRCSEAFSGAFCEEDRDGCTEIQCFEGVECRDVPAPGVGAVCGACPEGYTGDEVKCYDIDECSQNETNNCDQLCINTDGSFVCACMEGFEFIEETNQCEDINECDQANDCHQECQNTVGSFICSCTEGFILAEDGKNCTANQVCADTNICSDICANVNGEEKCFCPIGFQLSTPGGSQCVDVDECQGTTPCDQLCMNTVGSYECGCNSGYELQQDEQTCEDIDECLEAAINSIDRCEDIENSQCVNAIGSYNCSCVSGYEMIGGFCERIQEVVPPPSPIEPSDVIVENSLNFTTSALTPFTFTPDVQQMFREVTAIVVNEYCSVINCTVISRVEVTREIVNLQVGPPNIAIPPSLITQEDVQLTFIFYVQLMDDTFLMREDLLEAVQLGENQYRSAGLLPMLVTTTAMPSEVPTQSSTEFEATSAATQTTTATTAIPSEVPTQPSTEFEVTTPLTTQTPTDIPPGIPFCDCGRHVECTVEGKFLMDGNVHLIVGTQMKCSVQLETTVAASIRDQANIDETFDQNFLSPGSRLFLKNLGVIVEAPENMQPCNISSFTQHQNPGVVFQELGLVGLSYSYLKEDGAFDSLYMSTDELQAIDSNSDIFTHLAEDLGSENSCSFQSLLYYLTTGLQYLLETAVCRVFTSEDAVTVVNFTAYCG